MMWRNRLALLLGAASPFALSDPAIAGTAANSEAGLKRVEPHADRKLLFWSDPAHANGALQLAQHRSHSSHSSHRSHYSSSGGGSVAPRVYIPPAAPRRRTPVAPILPAPRQQPSPTQPLPSSPDGSASATSTVAPRMGQSELREIVRRVQMALIVRGYDPGAADGVLGTRTRTALRAYQQASGFTVSGYLDAATLNGLGVQN